MIKNIVLNATKRLGLVGALTIFLLASGLPAQADIPTITGFSPVTGYAGQSLSISGTDFVPGSTVTIGGAAAGPAQVVVNSATSISVLQLPLGAVTGPIAVTTPEGTAISSTDFTVTAPPAPTVLGFSPTIAAPGALISISGTNLFGTTAVLFNGTSAAYTVLSDFQVTATLPAGASTGPISVSTTSGTAVSASNFTVNVAPTITSFTPTTITSGMPVTITGTAFANTTNVRFNGVSAVFSVVSSTQISATVPSGLLTNGPITVTTFGGTATSAASYTLTSAPILTSVTPGSGPEKRIVTLSGFNFTGTGISSLSVRLNGLNITSFFVSSPTQVRFAVPAGATSGPITVQTSQGTATSATSFIVAAGSPPANDNFANAQVLTGASGLVAGTNTNATKEPGEPNHAGNAGGASVWFTWTAPGSGAFLFNPVASNFGVLLAAYTGGSANALTPAAGGSASNPLAPAFANGFVLNASAGTTYAIALDGITGSMGDYALAWSPVIAPTITSFTPSTGFAGQLVQINGTGFVPGSTVTFGGAAASPAQVVVNSPTSLSVLQLPLGAVTGPIAVTTPAGTAVSSTNFTVITPPAPLITGFNPASGAPGALITINGSRLLGTTAVRFNGTSAAYTVVSDLLVTATVPAGATTGPISVTTPSGTAASAGNFTVNAALTITGFTPATIAPSMPVTITGTGFTGVTSVRFNGVNAAFTVNSSTQITATAPNTLTNGPISVTTTAGTATSPASYTVTLVPIITGFTPGSGPEKQIVRLNGFNFTGSGISLLSVKLAGMHIASVSSTPNQIRFPVPAGATSGPITVETSQGTTTSATSFVVAAGSPPANDNFANAQVLTGASGSVAGTNTNANKEPGEPDHAGNAGGASVWFTWTAPASGPFLFNPVGSGFGVLLTAYTGASVNALTPAASGSASSPFIPTFANGFALNATAGSTYVIALDSINGWMADYTLAWSPVAAPTITSFSPTTGYAGQRITIFGTGFVPGSTVTFGGAAASPAQVSVGSSTSLSAQLPSGVVTGPITVTTPAGTATSATNFVVTSAPPPTIASFSPPSGGVGGDVLILGTALSLGDGATLVRFNGAQATMVGQSSTSLNVLVPAGATTGPITVETSRGTATSSTNFVFTGPFPATVTLDGLLQVYDGSPKSATVTTLPAGLATAVTYDGSATLPVNPGTYAVVVTVTEPNYTGSATGTLTIGQAAATVTISGTTQTYNGSARPVAVSTEPAGLTAIVTYNGSATAPTNAGSYTVVATVDDPNYTGSATGTLTIAQAAATVTISGTIQTYNGFARPVAVSTEPTGLPTIVTYNGSATAPTNTGSYPVVATVDDPNYTGSATGTLTIGQAAAGVTLSNLRQTYDGTPRPATASTAPAGLAVILTYDGSPTPPTNPGSYAVVATIDDPNHIGSASATLVITITALVRHAPTLNGDVDGAMQVLLGENTTLNGSAMISGDLLVPGTPTVQLNGNPAYGGTVNGTGSASPSNYRVTLNGNAILQRLVRRTDPIALPTVSAPPGPGGTVNVTLNNSSQVVSDWAVLRNLTLNGNALQVTAPAGTYGSFTANGNGSIILGVEGATQPAVYNLQNLTLNGNSQLRIVGPVILTLANGVNVNGNVGTPAHPEWLVLRIASGGVTLNGNVAFCGSIVAPAGTVTINGNSTLTGEISADRFTVNGNGLLLQPAP